MSEREPEYLINSHGLQIHAGPSPLDFSPCPHCGEEVDWTAVPAHHCIGTLRTKRPIFDPAGFNPAYHWICGICGHWFDPQQADEHVCGLRRPTYDELALAVLAFRHARQTTDIDRRDDAAVALVSLARRLDPGP